MMRMVVLIYKLNGKILNIIIYANLMPTYCYSDITIITYDKSQPIYRVIVKFKHEGADIRITKRSDNAIEFTIVTEVQPNYCWLHTLTDKYPAWWLKNLWWSENGTAGVWVGYHKQCKKILKSTDWDHPFVYTSRDDINESLKGYALPNLRPSISIEDITDMN